MTVSTAPRIRTWAEVKQIAVADYRWRFGRRILDIRAADDHLPGSVSLPVAADQAWAEALPSFLLGNRDQEVVVLADSSARAREAADHLRGRGWSADYCAKSPPANELSNGPADGELWRPDPFLQDLVPSLPPPSAGAALDLGAGSGRDTCYLASMGYNCLMVDRYPDALQLGRQRAQRLGVEVRTRLQDLSQPKAVAGSYAVALSIRFLERQQLDRMSEVLKPGGVLVVHTFAPSPLAQTSGHARERFRLGAEEFHARFPAPHWEFVQEPRLLDQHGDRWIQGAVRRLR